VSRKVVIAYWLIPAEPARSFFQGVINDLARRYDAPVFEPHVTIHVGANHADMAESALTKAARDYERIALQTRGVSHSSEFTKTLFVQFALTAKLRRLNRIIRTAAEDSSDYRLNPHLSLIYKTMPVAARRELADSIKTPFSKVAFEALKAVRCISPTRSRTDVEAWRIVAEESLGSIGV
jgi:2'-5' RNA ligase